jgi:hypothetical protein
MDALETLEPGATLTLLLPREPFPLYAALAKQGFAHRTTLDAEGTFTIRITHAR